MCVGKRFRRALTHRTSISVRLNFTGCKCKPALTCINLSSVDSPSKLHRNVLDPQIQRKFSCSTTFLSDTSLNQQALQVPGSNNDLWRASLVRRATILFICIKSTNHHSIPQCPLWSLVSLLSCSYSQSPHYSMHARLLVWSRKKLTWIQVSRPSTWAWWCY